MGKRFTWDGVITKVDASSLNQKDFEAVHIGVFEWSGEFDHPEAVGNFSGIYINTCCKCRNKFAGYKNRIRCVKCNN